MPVYNTRTSCIWYCDRTHRLQTVRRTDIRAFNVSADALYSRVVCRITAGGAASGAAAAAGGGGGEGGAVVIPMPPVIGMPTYDPARVLQVQQLARIVKLFSVVDGMFVLVWSLSITPLLAAVALCAAGYYGATKFKVPYVGLVCIITSSHHHIALTATVIGPHFIVCVVCTVYVVSARFDRIPCVLDGVSR